MSFDSPKDIEDKYKMGYRHLAERFIVKKVEPYWSLMGWPMQPLYNALDGKGGLSWL